MFFLMYMCIRTLIKYDLILEKRLVLWIWTTASLVLLIIDWFKVICLQNSKISAWLLWTSRRWVKPSLQSSISITQDVSLELSRTLLMSSYTCTLEKTYIMSKSFTKTSTCYLNKIFSVWQIISECIKCSLCFYRFFTTNNMTTYKLI
jgi:hypothetical protein